jgi:hypothetical protein
MGMNITGMGDRLLSLGLVRTANPIILGKSKQYDHTSIGDVPCGMQALTELLHLRRSLSGHMHAVTVVHKEHTESSVQKVVNWVYSGT